MKSGRIPVPGKERWPLAEENDLPFVGNELRDSPATMDKPLDTADAPGKADSELIEDESDR